MFTSSVAYFFTGIKNTLMLPLRSYALSRRISIRQQTASRHSEYRRYVRQSKPELYEKMKYRQRECMRRLRERRKFEKQQLIKYASERCFPPVEFRTKSNMSKTSQQLVKGENVEEKSVTVLDITDEEDFIG